MNLGKTGRRAEQLAERYLRKRGYKRLARNLRIGKDEIDLIMRSPDATCVILVEVKGSTRSIHRARTMLDAKKGRRLARALTTFERANLNHNHPIRLDAIYVALDPKAKKATNIEHIKGPLLRSPEIRS